MTLRATPDAEDAFEASWFDVTPRHPISLGVERLAIRLTEPAYIEGYKIYHGQHGDCLYIDNFTTTRNVGLHDEIIIDLGNLLVAMEHMFGREVASNLTLTLVSQNEEANQHLRLIPPFRRLRKRKPVDIETNVNWLTEGF